MVPKVIQIISLSPWLVKEAAQLFCSPLFLMMECRSGQPAFGLLPASCYNPSALSWGAEDL